MPQGPGVDNLALAFDAPKGTTIEDGYRMLTEIIKRGLGEHGAALEVGDTLGSFCDGAWNLSFEGRKIVGTAQRWRPMPDGRRRVLAHALILTNPDIREATEAVSAFQRDLGLGLVDLEAHTSAGTAFHLTELPAASLLDAAEKALGVFEPMLLD